MRERSVDKSDLASFLEEAHQAAPLRIEADLGGGFVRLRVDEAEKRQAAQDIRSSEDVVIELLRNARDAHSRHIFCALHRVDDIRTITMIDDGDGIPSAMFERIFEPRVTSKLDTAHMDKWGMHGRGMALYSIACNSQSAFVAASMEGEGSALVVRTDLPKLGERTDQSTFPRFEIKEDGSFAMRGPRNILRVACEFALECKGDCAVYVGSPIEIAAALYGFAMASTTPAMRAFGRAGGGEEVPFIKRLALASDPDDLARRASQMGLSLSSRSARRIMNGEVIPPVALYERLKEEALGEASSKAALTASQVKRPSAQRDARSPVRLTEEDKASLARAASRAFAPIAQAYFLDDEVKPEVSVRAGQLLIAIPLERS